MDPLFSLSQYIRYLLKAKGANGIHSPFVFEFYNEVLANPHSFYAFEELEEIRESTLRDNTPLEFMDPGVRKEIRKTTVGKQASKSLMPSDKSILLFQLSHWLKPNLVLELGTSFGITTAYLARAFPSRIVTMEGAQPIAEKAKENWKALGITQIESLVGPIETLLPAWLKEPGNIPDLVIVDANHSYEATLNNFRLLAKNVKETTCLVFDDIYWSKEMAKAWKEIIGDMQVTVTVDIFGLGFVFFRKESQKENFTLRC